MPKHDFSNMMDVIDSRDVIARIVELENERDMFEAHDLETFAEHVRQNPGEWDATKEWAYENPDDADELRILLALQDEASGYAADWEYGEALIRDSYFADYAQQLAEDCGMLENATAWPLTCIDWDAAAEALKQDYTSVDYDGVTYWIR